MQSALQLCRTRVLNKLIQYCEIRKKVQRGCSKDLCSSKAQFSLKNDECDMGGECNQSFPGLFAPQFFKNGKALGTRLWKWIDSIYSDTLYWDDNRPKRLQGKTPPTNPSPQITHNAAPLKDGPLFFWRGGWEIFLCKQFFWISAPLQSFLFQKHLPENIIFLF